MSHEFTVNHKFSFAGLPTRIALDITHLSDPQVAASLGKVATALAAINVSLVSLTDRVTSLEKAMSAISDKIAALDTTVAAAETRVSTDLADLKAKIAELQATVDSGGATQADLDALDALTNRVKALDPHDATTASGTPDQPILPAPTP